MKLRQRILLIFATTVLVGVGLLYFLSRGLLLSSFLQLETLEMQEDVQHAVTALNHSFTELGTITSDNAYWDRTYEFMADPGKNDISGEYQNGSLDVLGLNLVVIRDYQCRILFAKSYDTEKHVETPVPRDFLEKMFARPEMSTAAIARMPLDGIAAFPDGAYLVSTRPILTSARKGEPRGVFLLARRFDETGASEISDLTQISAKFLRVTDENPPSDFASALAALKSSPKEVFVQRISENSIGGYVLINDVFGDPLFILRVDTARPIFARGKLSQKYMFVAVFGEVVLSSVVILLLLQRLVLSRLNCLGWAVQSIGKRKAITERLPVTSNDELCSLAGSINGMLDELEKAQALFLFLTENIHQAFWVKNATTKAFEYLSPSFENIWGCSRDALTKNPEAWSERLHPEDQSVAARIRLDQAAGNNSKSYYRIVAEDGSVRWLWERSFCVRGKGGQFKQIIGLTEDVTDFKRNEEALLNAQQELEERVAQRTAELAERGELVELLVDSAPGAVYGIDLEGKFTFCNPAALRLLGYSDAGELLGKSAHALVHHTKPDGNLYPLEECPVMASFQVGKDARVDGEVFWRKDGTSFLVGYNSRQIRRKGKPVGAVVMFADITDRQRREMEARSRQKLQAVGGLAAGIAHEINTPIQFVGDNTRFLQTAFQDELRLIQKYEELFDAASFGSVSPELLDEVAAVRKLTDWPYLQNEIPKAMGQMLEGLDRVSTIVRGMKEFSHVDRANEKSPGDLNRALESTLIVTRNEWKYVAEIETDYGAIPPVVCHLGDLNQVFLNLLVNAAHAIEDVVKGTGKKGKIRVQTRQDGDWVEINISDSGTGIPEEFRERIFEPFFTTKEVGRGTGQGLALARAIVEKHGGTLTFQNELGKGTTFTIWLPISGAPVREEAPTV